MHLLIELRFTKLWIIKIAWCLSLSICSRVVRLLITLVIIWLLSSISIMIVLTICLLLTRLCRWPSWIILKWIRFNCNIFIPLCIITEYFICLIDKLKMFCIVLIYIWMILLHQFIILFFNLFICWILVDI